MLYYSLFSPVLQGRKFTANLFQKKPALPGHSQMYFPHIQTYKEIPSAKAPPGSQTSVKCHLGNIYRYKEKNG